MLAPVTRPALSDRLRINSAGQLLRLNPGLGTCFPVRGLCDATAPGDWQPSILYCVELSQPAPDLAPDAPAPAELLAEAEAAERAFWWLLGGMALLLTALCLLLWWPTSATTPDDERPAGWPVNAPYNSDTANS